MRPATPAQYLERLTTWDEIAFDLTRFEGFTEMDDSFSIVTSQTWFEGRNSTWKEIKTDLLDRGFRAVVSDAFDDPTRWYHPEQDLALFDVGESNILWVDGVLVPIDIVPVHLRGLLRDQLHRWLKL
jgi:hypothetical protein